MFSRRYGGGVVHLFGDSVQVKNRTMGNDMTELGAAPLNRSSTTTRRRALQLGALTAGGLLLGATAAAGSVPIKQEAASAAAPLLEGTVALKSLYNNRYVCAEAHGAKPRSPTAPRSALGRPSICSWSAKSAPSAHSSLCGRTPTASTSAQRPRVANP